MRTSDLGAEENIQGMRALITGPFVNKHECRSEDVRDILSVLPRHQLWHLLCRVKRAWADD